MDFESGGTDPLYLTVRSVDEGVYYVDISNKSQIAVVDTLGNAMLLDHAGLHFSTRNCSYTVSITVLNLYQQLAELAGAQCNVGGLDKRLEDMDFRQVLNLYDQCGDPINRSIRPYPILSVGDTSCTNTDVDEFIGEWEFDCTFPGSQSGSMKCQRAIKNDVVDFLLRDPFGGACPDLSTVVTTLAANGGDIISVASFLTELLNQGLTEAQRLEAERVSLAYMQLWDVLQQSLSKSRPTPPGNLSALENYIDLYNTYRDFEDDICEDLHAGERPLPLSLAAGATTTVLTTLNWAPDTPRIYNLTIQDPSKIACCPDGRMAEDDGDVCAYPADAVIQDSTCVCGRTASGRSLAFEVTECENYVSNCVNDGDCADEGYPGYVCLVGSCCGGGVCVDPYECSQNGTLLVG